MGIELDRGKENDGALEVALLAKALGRSLAVGLLAVVTALAAAPGTASAQAAPAAPFVSHLQGPVLSPRLSDLPPAHFAATPHEIPLHHPPAAGPGPRLRPQGSGGVQTSPGPQLPVTSGAKFPGISYNGSWPPDPNIAVGKTVSGVGYIVQVANTEIAVFNKSTGEMLSGYPKNLSDLWLNTVCATNSGDPIVQYDSLAPDGLNDGGTGRWLITQLGSLSGPFSECLAISATSDPTGNYYLYQQGFGDYFNDYPKFGIWPTKSNSAYLATYNLFWLGISFSGAELCAYDRNALLNHSSSAAAICYNVNSPSYLPSDLDGATAPADKTPGYFLDFPTTSSLGLYELAPDFTNTRNSVFTHEPNISVASFGEACRGGSCIPQPNTSQKLDSLGDRLMYRLAYRIWTDSSSVVHTSMVVNHSVMIGKSGVGVRWYEMRPAGSSFNVYQYGTYAPTSAFRWMGSMAMDGAGDIALGYSESSGSIYPQIVFTGRTPGMTLGTLGSEYLLQAGGGSQTGTNRWGDYTSLRIDPQDDTTFWYTNEYYYPSSPNQWSTFIGSFTE